MPASTPTFAILIALASTATSFATVLLSALLLPTDASDSSTPRRRGHALTLFDTTETAL